MSSIDPNKSQHIMSRLMSLTTFFITILIEVYAVLYNTSFNYLIEIVSINFIFILTLLGIRSWLTTKMFSISTMGNGNGNGHNQNQVYGQQQTHVQHDSSAGGVGNAKKNAPFVSMSIQANIENTDSQSMNTNENENTSERKKKFMVDR